MQVSACMSSRHPKKVRLETVSRPAGIVLRPPSRRGGGKPGQSGGRRPRRRFNSSVRSLAGEPGGHVALLVEEHQVGDALRVHAHHDALAAGAVGQDEGRVLPLQDQRARFSRAIS